MAARENTCCLVHVAYEWGQSGLLHFGDPIWTMCNKSHAMQSAIFHQKMSMLYCPIVASYPTLCKSCLLYLVRISEAFVLTSSASLCSTCNINNLRIMVLFKKKKSLPVQCCRLEQIIGTRNLTHDWFCCCALARPSGLAVLLQVYISICSIIQPPKCFI